MNIFDKYPDSQFLKDLPNGHLRERIAELFSFMDGLEDPNFEDQMDQDPYAALWEMMVAKILKTEGYQPTRKTNGGPDFVVEKHGKRIFIEAVCPGPGLENYPDSVPPMVYGARVAQRLPVAQIVLRIANALDVKKNKYAHYRELGITSESDVCVIAVNLSKFDRAFESEPPIIMRATHGLGDPYVILGQEEGIVGQGYESYDCIPKVTGENVSTTFFLCGDNSSISAVLYSGCSCFSDVYDLFKESLLIHNPKALVPMNLGVIKQIEDVWTICCHEDLHWRAYRMNNARYFDQRNGSNLP